MRLYLAGGMTGYPEKNFPMFHKVAAQLRRKRHTVWSPAEADISIGFDPVMNFDNKQMGYFMKYELPIVCSSDAVAVLPGWEKSLGANLEVHVARICNIPVVDALTLKPVKKLN